MQFVRSKGSFHKGSGPSQTDVHQGAQNLSSLKSSAHLWIVEADCALDTRSASRFLQMLSAAERARLDTFHFPNDQQRFLVSHALVRSVLSFYCQVSPDEWRFTEGEGGRPEVLNSEGLQLGLRFNLSHTKGLVACVVSREIDCGVDVENEYRHLDPAEVAGYALHPLEQQALKAIPEEGQLSHFLAFWTAKEACMKACGRGLSLAPNSFALEINDDCTSARVVEAPDGLDWQIALMQPNSSHHLAVALDPAGRQHICVNYLSRDLSALI